ncbi:lutropin subunit beta [Hypomesus transpacificus]|uniref:lutropin subunit beta n=1 Tax=Hypomesus transpacificus TaxID=137520 RepID=UPI001F078976|nr:lutropin subunit beta [Hypomesus transpacificus]XP_046885932.1 lutropin subunit beta [Hypomesus transpacificus]XP_046885933.1 lutropin subunit beta [Hypomesus transpacificus]XP_046885934.1 lutropin subunit beta [Hypomesus transpacificus]
MLGTSVSCVTFLLLLHLLFCLNPSVASHLQHCQPINQTVSVEKEGCPTCLVFETSICSGHCLTKEPVRRRPYKPVSQHVCTYRDVHYQTVRLPDCPPNVDPFVTLPVALSCECNMCTMDTSDCTIESLKPDFCMTQTAFEPAYY